MLKFNNDQYHNAIKMSGLSANEDPYYKELITSEINYINNFLNYLNDADIDALLKVYTSKKYKPSANDMSKDSLRYLYNSLKNIHKKQSDVLPAFYQGDPLLWQTAINSLYDSYVHYISIRQGMIIPNLLEEKFKEIRVAKVVQGFPSGGTLDSIFISPIQRLPRYALLGRELSKDAEKKLLSEPNEALITFSEKLVLFNQSMTELNQKINKALASPLTSETLNEFLHSNPSGAQEISDEEPASPYLTRAAKAHKRETPIELPKKAMRAGKRSKR